MSLRDYLGQDLSHLLVECPAPLLVIGNESGDLDTFVSSLVLAWHLNDESTCPAFPLLPFAREDVPLKTEVLECFARLGLSLRNVPCLGEVDTDKMQGVKVVLVDHNVVNVPEILHLDEAVTQVEKRRRNWLCSMDGNAFVFLMKVYDHHELERKTRPRGQFIVEKVGSCSTLIAEKVFSEKQDEKVSHYYRLNPPGEKSLH